MQMSSPAPRIIWQNRPARHRRAVFFCADDRYVPYTLFLAQQIATAHPQRDFDLCIVSAAPLAAHDLFAQLDMRLVQMDMAALEARANIGARIGLATYLRLFMPDLWAGEYDRLLYMDGDVFYQRGDIAALLGADLHGAPVGAVLDTKQWHKPRRPAADIAALGLPHAPYLNGGVLLMDVARFRALGLGGQIVELILQRGHDLIWHDQTALNAVLRGGWAQLPVQWNFQYSHKTMLLSAHFDVCLYHFIGRRKPFYAAYGGFPRRFTAPYRAFLAQHFPALAPLVPDGTGGPRRWRQLALIFLFNWGMARGALRMEQLQTGDFDILPPPGQ
jgi:hypothetical protein